MNAYLRGMSRGSVLKSEHEAAALQFLEKAQDKEKKAGLIKPRNNIQDVQHTLKECSGLYEGRKPDSKALKWLRLLSEKMVFYEGVVDVLIQQHPESASLIWGGMKFLFMVR